MLMAEEFYRGPKMQRPSHSERLADFIVDLSLEDLPESLVKKTKDTVIDAIGVTIASQDSPQSRMALKFIRQLPGDAESTVIGVRDKTSCINAAFANAVIGKSYDYDGGAVVAHSCPIIVPVAFALSERESLPGKNLLEAIVIGIEVMGRVARALGPGLQTPPGSIHMTSTTGVFGATAAAGKLLSLDKERLTMALGIAGSYVGGTEAYLQDGAFTSAIHCAKPAHDGIVCALLAREGFTGPRWIFEGIDGLSQSYGCSGETNISELTDGLGNSWLTGPRGKGYREYACCARSWPHIKALAEIVSEQHLDPDDISRIKAWMSAESLMTVGVPRESGTHPNDRKDAPLSIVDGIFSLSFCLGMMAYCQRITPKEWSDGSILNNSKILSLAHRVETLVDKELTSIHTGTVELIAKDGKSYRKKCTYDKRWTKEDIQLKFLDCSDHGKLQKTKATRLLHLLRELETLENISEITDILATRI